MKISNFVLITTMAFLQLMAISCENDDDDDNIEDVSEFTSLESPYLICASRNPGGVGFDFTYNDSEGGANYLDSTTVDDFDEDLYIITVKGENADSTLSGAPYIKLMDGATAVNYSSVDTSCTGITAFEALTSNDVLDYTLAADDEDFDLSDLETGYTGKIYLSELQNEYTKLVIGERWKSTAKNTIDEDEIVWIIETKEGDLVKFIVTDFPATDAPTSTGYIDIDWDYLN
jgi:hypothetical protein